MDFVNLVQKLDAEQMDEHTAKISENGNDMFITITTSNNLCNILIYSDIIQSKHAKNTIDSLNNDQSFMFFRLNDNKLSLKSTIWVDRKPTLAGLSEITSMMIAYFKIAKNMLERSNQ